MRSVSKPWSLSMFALLAACGSGDAAAPAAPTPSAPAAPTATAPTAPAEPSGQPPSSGAPSSTRVGAAVDRAAAAAARQHPEARERSRQVRTALRAGRAAAQAGQHQAALPHFEQALALAPSDERLLCETGFVAYRAGDLDRAALLVGKALERFGNPQQVAEAMRVPFAMCLYNAGRVAEDRAHADEARERYRTSLMLRENRIVRERLEGLGAAAAAPAARASGTASLDALVARLREVRCGASDADEEGGTCDVEVEQQVSGGSAELSEAALVRVVTGDLGSETYLELALRGRDGWHAAGTVLYVYNPGAFGISEEGEVGELEFTALVPGGPSALRVDISHNRSDADIGINEAEFTSDTSTVLCGAVDGAPRCVRLPREHDYTREVMEAGGEDDEEPHEGLPIHERYVIDLAFQPEAVTVTLQASEGALPTQLARWAGSHPLLDLLRSPDLALHVDL